MLDSVGLSGPFPTFWASMRSLCLLRISHTNLTGLLPASLGAIGGNGTCMKTLYLHNNRLFGPVPREIFTRGNLSTLFLGNNMLSGPLPQEVTLCTSLQSLDLEGNLMTWTRVGVRAFLGNAATYVLESWQQLLRGHRPKHIPCRTTSGIRNLVLSNNMFSGAPPAFR